MLTSMFKRSSGIQPKPQTIKTYRIKASSEEILLKSTIFTPGVPKSSFTTYHQDNNPSVSDSNTAGSNTSDVPESSVETHHQGNDQNTSDSNASESIASNNNISDSNTPMIAPITNMGPTVATNEPVAMISISQLKFKKRPGTASPKETTSISKNHQDIKSSKPTTTTATDKNNAKKPRTPAQLAADQLRRDGTITKPLKIQNRTRWMSDYGENRIYGRPSDSTKEMEDVEEEVYISPPLSSSPVVEESDGEEEYIRDAKRRRIVL